MAADTLTPVVDILPEPARDSTASRLWAWV